MEVEAKVRVPRLEEMRKRLESMGAVFYPEKRQHDSIFKRKGEELAPQKPGGFILRVRESSKNTLTIKVLTDRAGVWIEHETGISDPKAAKDLLEAAGFAQVLTMTKARIPGKLGDFELCLDDIKELGTHLEIALDSQDGNAAKKKIVELLGKLGFQEKDVIHKGYVAILFERLGVTFDGTG
jgi:predicted adenylyl cyclase CyaB